MRNESVQVSISASALALAYAENWDAARDRYHGRLLEVTGVVDIVAPQDTEQGRMVLLEQSTGEPLRIVCWFRHSESRKAGELRHGDTLTFRGQDSSSVPEEADRLGVLLWYCIVISVEHKKGCFVATAVYGSAEHPDVRLLREFRDKILLQSALGRITVRLYYFTAPILVTFIRTESAKFIIRALILPPVILAIRRRLEQRSK